MAARRTGVRGRLALGQRDLAGHRLGHHVVAVDQHELDQSDHRRRLDPGQFRAGVGGARRCRARCRAGRGHRALRSRARRALHSEGLGERQGGGDVGLAEPLGVSVVELLGCRPGAVDGQRGGRAAEAAGRDVGVPAGLVDRPGVERTVVVDLGRRGAAERLLGGRGQLVEAGRTGVEGLAVDASVGSPPPTRSPRPAWAPATTRVGIR